VKANAKKSGIRIDILVVFRVQEDAFYRQNERGTDSDETRFLLEFESQINEYTSPRGRHGEMGRGVLPHLLCVRRANVVRNGCKFRPNLHLSLEQLTLVERGRLERWPCECERVPIISKRCSYGGCQSIFGMVILAHASLHRRRTLKGNDS
jgi:hypothetical protein